MSENNSKPSRDHLAAMAMQGLIASNFYDRVNESRRANYDNLVKTTDHAHLGKMTQPIHTLNLSVRASNGLDRDGIRTIGDLVSRTKADLLRIQAFGRTSLREVEKKLADIGLELGMDGSIDVQYPTVAFLVAVAYEYADAMVAAQRCGGRQS